MDVTQKYVKPNQDKTALDSVCHQDHKILFIQSCYELMLRRPFIFKRRSEGCHTISPFPMSGSPRALQLTSLKLLRENWQNKGFFPSHIQLKEKISKPQLTSPLPDPGILNGFLASSPLERH